MLAVRISVEDCGKPLLIWLAVYVAIYFLKLLIIAISLILAYKGSQKLKVMTLVKFMIMNPLQIAWLTYGNIIFYQFKPERDC